MFPGRQKERPQVGVDEDVKGMKQNWIQAPLMETGWACWTLGIPGYPSHPKSRFFSKLFMEVPKLSNV